MFLAGMKTIQVSSSNTIMYLAGHPEIKQKLIAEVDSFLTPIADDLQEKSTMEIADQFSYLLYCYWESLRVEPPVPVTTSTAFTEDVDIQGITFRAKDPIMLNIQQVHHDPTQW